MHFCLFGASRSDLKPKHQVKGFQVEVWGHRVTFRITFLGGLACWYGGLGILLPKHGCWAGMLLGEYIANWIPAGSFAGCLQLGFAGFWLVFGCLVVLRVFFPDHMQNLCEW